MKTYLFTNNPQITRIIWNEMKSLQSLLSPITKMMKTDHNFWNSDIQNSCLYTANYHPKQTWHKWGCMRSIRTTTEIYSSKFSLHRNQSEIIMFFCAPPNHNRYLNLVLSLNQNPNCVLGHYQNLQLWCIPPKSWRCASKKISFRRKLMPLAFKTRTGRK